MNLNQKPWENVSPFKVFIKIFFLLFSIEFILNQRGDKKLGKMTVKLQDIDYWTKKEIVSKGLQMLTIKLISLFTARLLFLLKHIQTFRLKNSKFEQG